MLLVKMSLLVKYIMAAPISSPMEEVDATLWDSDGIAMEIRTGIAGRRERKREGLLVLRMVFQDLLLAR